MYASQKRAKTNIAHFSSYHKHLRTFEYFGEQFCVVSYDKLVYDALFSGQGALLKSEIEVKYNSEIGFLTYEDRINKGHEFCSFADSVSDVSRDQITRSVRTGSLVYVKGPEAHAVEQAAHTVVNCVDQLLQYDNASISGRAAGGGGRWGHGHGHGRGRQDTPEGDVRIRKRLDYSHFVALNIGSPEVCDSVRSFQKVAIETLCGSDPGGASARGPGGHRKPLRRVDLERMFMRPAALHVTLIMLKLHSDDMRERAEQAMAATPAQLSVALGGRPLVLRLAGLRCMGTRPDAARVIYAGVLDDLFSSSAAATGSAIPNTSNSGVSTPTSRAGEREGQWGGQAGAESAEADVLGNVDRILQLRSVFLSRLGDRGLLLRQERDTLGLLSHVTVINTKYGSRNGSASSIDATALLDLCRDLDFGCAAVPVVHLCLRKPELLVPMALPVVTAEQEAAGRETADPEDTESPRREAKITNTAPFKAAPPRAGGGYMTQCFVKLPVPRSGSAS